MNPIKNAAKDIYNLGASLIGMPKTIFHDIPSEAVKLYQEQGIKQGGANFLRSLPPAAWQMAQQLVPKSMQALGGFDEAKQIPDAFHQLAETEGGYGKALLSTLRELPYSVPEGLYGELHNVGQAAEAFADHPVNEALGWVGIQHLVDSLGQMSQAKGQTQLDMGDVKGRIKNSLAYKGQDEVVLKGAELQGRIDDIAQKLGDKGDAFRQTAANLSGDIKLQNLIDEGLKFAPAFGIGHLKDWLKDWGSTTYTVPRADAGEKPVLYDLDKGSIAGYDFNKWAAANPGHTKGVADIYESLYTADRGTDAPPDNPFWVVQGDIGRVNEAQKGKSPLNARMVYEAARRHDVDPLLLAAMIRQDSSYGLKGMGAKDKNPTNWGTWEEDRGGKKVTRRAKFDTWAEGLDYAAKHLAEMKM